MFKITRTKTGKTKLARAADPLGIESATVLNVRNWRTRTVTVAGETYQVHDEEWLLLLPDGHEMAIEGEDLAVLREQMSAGWFRAEMGKGGAK